MSKFLEQRQVLFQKMAQIDQMECVAPVSLRSGKNRAPAGFLRFDVAGRETSASQPQPAVAMACA